MPLPGIQKRSTDGLYCLTPEGFYILSLGGACGCSPYVDPDCCETDCSHWLSFTGSGVSVVECEDGMPKTEADGCADERELVGPFVTKSYEVRGKLQGLAYNAGDDNCAEVFDGARRGGLYEGYMQTREDGGDWSAGSSVTCEWAKFGDDEGWYTPAGLVTADCLEGATASYSDGGDFGTDSFSITFAERDFELEDDFTGAPSIDYSWCDEPGTPCRICRSSASTIAVTITVDGVDYPFTATKTDSGTNGPGGTFDTPSNCRYTLSGSIAGQVWTGGILGTEQGFTLSASRSGVGSFELITGPCGGSANATLLSTYTERPNDDAFGQTPYMLAHTITAVAA